MGYRSDVCIALTDNATRLLKTIVSHLPEAHEVHSLLRQDEGSFIDITPLDLQDKTKELSSKIYFESIKWYDGFECVSLIEEVLEGVDDENWLLARVGEDSEDCDVRGGFHDSVVYIRRSIDW